MLELQVGGLRRRALVYRPDCLSDRPGVVLVLHGAVASAEQMARESGFNLEADRLGWLAVYPEAHNPSVGGGWDSFACCSQPGVDDLAFMAGLLERVQAEHGLDPGRAFVSGFSRGGMMAHRLGCQLSERVAGIAPVAGNLADSGGRIDVAAWRPSQPVPVLVIHGSDDLNVPVGGGVSSLYPDQIPYAPLDQVMAAWAEWNGCDTDAADERREGVVLSRSWPGGRRRVELRLVQGGSHTWPGSGHEAGTPDAGFDASRAIADFFSSL